MTIAISDPVRHRAISVDLPGSDPAADAGALALRYLGKLDHGVLLIDAEGRLALCSDEARRLLGLDGSRSFTGLRAVILLRRRDLATSAQRRVLVDLFRAALREHQPSTVDVEVADRALRVTCKPLPREGWAVMIEDAAKHQSISSALLGGTHDGLTGLPNRNLFGSKLEEARQRLERTGEAFALLSVDLDRFKQVNDTLGHPVGDALLRVVAERLRSVVRSADCVARLGGDEFGVLLSGVLDTEAAAALARRIVDLVGRAYMIEGQLVNVGASVGVTMAPADGSAVDQLLKNADLALYGAKSEGRDTFRFFEPVMEERMQARRQLEIDLRKALALREFELHYQPQLNLDTDRLVGCEALIRWRHPVRGLVLPGEFIPLAEEVGLIIAIGEWVVRTACKEAVQWPGDIAIAVNLSPAQFKSKKLVDSVASALRTSGLAPHRLELEITEGVLLHDSDANLSTLHALRDLGLRISMDDFGTGYSSLSYLRAFPFDKIKIDQSFIADLGTKPDSNAIVRAIASLGTSFGMTTVAEGVETLDQMQRIRKEGCTDVQGYLISRPVPGSEIIRLFTDESRQHQPAEPSPSQ